MFLLNKVNQVRVTIWGEGNVTMSAMIKYISKKHGIYLSMVSLDGIYMGATVWRQDKLLVLLFYNGVTNKHMKQAHSKPLIQTVISLQNSASRFSKVHCQQCGRQKRSLASPDAP
jgi:hypothetical protein